MPPMRRSHPRPQAAADNHLAIESGSRSADAPEMKPHGGGAPTDTGRTYRTVAIGNVSTSAQCLSEEPFRMGASARLSSGKSRIGRHAPSPARAGPPATGPGVPNNYLKTSTYTIVNFIPKNLFIQFHRLTNIYFLLVSFLQMIRASASTLCRGGVPFIS
jgi:hypothetical protein